MGLYDSYKADPPIVCPLTGAKLTDFQGKCCRCALDTWKQGRREPLKRSHGHGIREHRPQDRDLPEDFKIHTSHDGKWYEVECTCEDGVWTKAELVSIDELSGGPPLSKNKRIWTRKRDKPSERT